MNRRLNPDIRAIRRVRPQPGRSRVSTFVLAASMALAWLSFAPVAVAQLVTVGVTASDASASETPADPGEFTVTRTGGSMVPVRVFYTVSGTASAGADYVALPGSVLLGLGQTEVTIPVNVSGDDGLFEGDETVTLRLSGNLLGGVAGGNATATVTISDTPHSVTVTAGANASEGPVSAGQLLVELNGQNQSGENLTVDYTVAGSAEPGQDYASLPEFVTIPVGSSSALLEVMPVADDILERDEDVAVTLTATSDPRAAVGDPDTAAILIEDDEARADDDGDGISNIDECPDVDPEVDDCRDTDDDGVPDYQDADDDGDGVPTASENAPSQDTDDDGVPDYLDDNDDGDGRLTPDEDLDEDGDGNPATNPTDIDDDGIPDYLDPDDQGGPTGDLDGDGLTNADEEELGTDPQNPDSDGDGVGDGVEHESGSDPLDPGSFADADGDRVPDSVETQDGTDPADPGSFLDSDGGGSADHIETTGYASYGLPPTDPLDHADDRRDLDGDGLPDRLELLIGSAADDADAPTADGAGDADGNGITNAVEAWLGTLGISASAAASDFDRDGYPDVAEVRLGLDPLSAEERDTDGDGVPDIVELLSGRDIDASTDSDADGVPDAREIALGADPLDANSPVVNGALDDDGDGISNAIEHVLQQLGAAASIDADSDIDGDGIGDADEIRLGADPFHDEQPTPWIELTQQQIGPVSAVGRDQGSVHARAVVGGHRSGSLSYDWSASENAVLAVVSGSTDARTLTFAPATLPAGTYRLLLRVQRTVGDYSSPESELEYTFRVLTSVNASELRDGDRDGVPDAADDFDGRLGFANVLQAQSGGQAALTAASGVRLQLGSTARAAQANAARVSLDNLGDGAGNDSDAFVFASGIYDFEVTNLPQAGAAVQIVIPQAQAIGEFPEYRKFVAGSWREYVEDDNNRVESAPANGGDCPEPGADTWRPGLTTGDACVQLTIEDGGPNDGDAAAGPNGVIKDPGGVATPEGEVNVGQGSGSMGAASLALLAFFLIARRWRHRPGTGAKAMPLTILLLLALPLQARADAFVGAGGGLSMLDPETGTTPFSVIDDQDFGYKVFAGIDFAPISRKLSVEAFWADLGQATLTGDGSIDYQVYGADLSFGVGSTRWPRLSGFLKTGVARLDASGNLPLRQEDDTLLFFGIAGSFALQRHLFLQLEYEYFAEDAQFLSLNLVKRFRMRPASDARTMPLPDR